MPATGAGYIADYLKANDPTRYYATLVLPEPAREAAQALYAFNAEVAAVAARVSDPAPGEIRLQWWVDALSGEGHGDVRANPVAAGLLDVIARYHLPVAPLVRLLEARRFDLYADPMTDVETFEGYAGETVSQLYQLTAMILNNGNAVQPGDAAGHLGVAHALIGHLHAFGYNASRGRIFLPWSILARNGVNDGEVLSGTVSEGLLAALGELHELADEHLTRAAAAIVLLPKELLPAFATFPVLRSELRAARRGAGAPYSPPQPIADWKKIAAMGWWTWRNS